MQRKKGSARYKKLEGWNALEGKLSTDCPPLRRFQEFNLLWCSGINERSKIIFDTKHNCTLFIVVSHMPHTRKMAIMTCLLFFFFFNLPFFISLFNTDFPLLVFQYLVSESMEMTFGTSVMSSVCKMRLLLKLNLLPGCAVVHCCIYKKETRKI